MDSIFELGQTVLISWRGEQTYARFNPWKQGTVTATGSNCVRVRIRGFFGFKNRWIRTDHPQWDVAVVND